MSTIDNTLRQRGERYGAFTGHAEITQGIKSVMKKSPNWSRLAPDQAEALEMVAHKIGRVLNGDPNHQDSWHDIIGYTRLVEQRLEAEQAASADVGTQPTAEKPQAPEEPCGCPACTIKRAVFAGLGIDDPTTIQRKTAERDFEQRLRAILGPNVEIVWAGE